MIYNHARHAYRQTNRFLGRAYHQATKYARGVDQFMDVAGRTFNVLSPLLDNVAPQTRRHLSRGVEDYDLVRARVMGAHQAGQRLVGALQSNVPELNLR